MGGKKELVLLALKRSEERQSGCNAPVIPRISHVALLNVFPRLEIPPPPSQGQAQGREVDWVTNLAQTEAAKSFPSALWSRCGVPSVRNGPSVSSFANAAALSLSFGLAVTASPRTGSSLSPHRRPSHGVASGTWKWRTEAAACLLANDLSTRTRTLSTSDSAAAQCSHL